MSDGSAKLVSLDLQPMAPLKHTTILQCDITVPSTIPLVLSNLRPSTTPSSSSATEIRKADLVICDGAPDVTGVHDLDAYLHYQLLLAAITLTLTILRKGGTAVYKVFLSPMDPKGEMLKSQVAPLFGGLMRDLELDLVEECAPEEMAGEIEQGEKERTGYGQIEDERRQHGVWMCKPRSSRAGSGGESDPGARPTGKPADSGRSHETDNDRSLPGVSRLRPLHPASAFSLLYCGAVGA